MSVMASPSGPACGCGNRSSGPPAHSAHGGRVGTTWTDSRWGLVTEPSRKNHRANAAPCSERRADARPNWRCMPVGVTPLAPEVMQAVEPALFERLLDNWVWTDPRRGHRDTFAHAAHG